MKIKLAYGQNGLLVNLPDYCQVVRSRFVPGVNGEVAALRVALE